MKHANTRAAIIAALVTAMGVALVSYVYFQRAAGPPTFQGWVEAEFLFISPDESGRVESLSVREGDAVAAGAPLFTLDADLQRAAVAENEAAVLNARLAYERAQTLLKRAVGSQKAFDDAESALRTAEARLNSARTRLERRKLLSPSAGTVQEIYFRAGEMVQSGRPIMSLLPPNNIKVRFFVPQAMLPKVRIGDRVSVQCDGCPRDLAAHVSFISAQAEFTPPVIYSPEERARLVFRIEAIPDRPDNFRVGQPVSVAIQAGLPSRMTHARK